MTENKSADWNWSDYFDHVIDPPVRETVTAALDILGDGQGRKAVDLGCGSGNDTVHILNAGFKVLAIDASPDGLARLRNRDVAQRNPNLEILQASFDDMKWPQNIWTNAGYALPFCPNPVFKNLWQNIRKNLERGGIFSGQLFGIEDSWNGKVSDMNFHDADNISDICRGYKMLHYREEKREGQDAVGRTKFWHVFHIVLQKQAK